jgi:hypothetical protein
MLDCGDEISISSPHFYVIPHFFMSSPRKRGTHKDKTQINFLARANLPLANLELSGSPQDLARTRRGPFLVAGPRSKR